MEITYNDNIEEIKKKIQEKRLDLDVCSECYLMLHYMGEHKWPNKCPACGRPTSELSV